MKISTWYSTVREDESGEWIIEFSNDMLLELGWSEGDILWFNVEDDGTVVLRKREDAKE